MRNTPDASAIDGVCRLRVVLYGLNFSPELTGIGKFTGELTAWLSARGHVVRVVTTPPYYPHWSIQPGFSGLRYRCEQHDGQTIWRCPLWVPSVPNGQKRLLHLASFVASSMPIMLRQVLWRPDVVMTVAPALMAAPIAWMTARQCGARAWLHVQDFEVDAAFGLGLLKSSRAKKAAYAVERWLMRRFDRVSTISPRMLERLSLKGVAAERTVLLPNWVDIKEIAPLPGSAYRNELQLPTDAIVALYAGNMGEKQGLDVIAEAARALEGAREIVFLLCGDGPGRPLLQRATTGLSNVRWLPLQPTARLNELLNAADVHLLPQKADAADLVMPSKLTGMLASGRPVVTTASAETQIARMVQRAGIVVPPGDGAAFATAIAALAADPERRARLGRQGREYAVEHLDRESVLGRFEAALFALAGPPRVRGAAPETRRIS